MSAEVLIRAATELRLDAGGHPVPEFAHAVADWLNVTAKDVGTSSLAFHAALTAARVYLGESDS